jgi:hypothetical protein
VVIEKQIKNNKIIKKDNINISGICNDEIDWLFEIIDEYLNHKNECLAPCNVFFFIILFLDKN